MVYGGTGSMSINQKSPNPAADIQQIQQRLWVREQEINALKVQNRHLLTKLDEAEQNGKPNQINTSLVASEVQKNLKPVLAEIEKSLKNAFEMLQSTMRGIYQQSSRAQQAVEEMTQHTRDIQNHMQDNVAASMNTFCDRLERQILSRLNGVDIMVQKQNEMLMDMETMKLAVNLMQKNSENNRSEVSRIEKESIEANQKLIEVQMQSRNAEEVTRDALQQIRNHRSEFKLLRGEVRAVLENSSRLSDKINLIDERLFEASGDIQTRQRERDQISKELKEIDGIDSIEDLIAIKNDDIVNIENAIQAGALDASKEDLTMVLELLQAQKSDLKKVAKDAENFLRNVKNEDISQEANRLANEEIHVTDLNDPNLGETNLQGNEQNT
jgi:chromosome segregation ATPase